MTTNRNFLSTKWNNFVGYCRQLNEKYGNNNSKLIAQMAETKPEDVILWIMMELKKWAQNLDEYMTTKGNKFELDLNKIEPAEYDKFKTYLTCFIEWAQQ